MEVELKRKDRLKIEKKLKSYLTLSVREVHDSFGVEFNDAVRSTWLVRSEIMKTFGNLSYKLN